MLSSLVERSEKHKSVVSDTRRHTENHIHGESNHGFTNVLGDLSVRSGLKTNGRIDTLHTSARILGLL